jgi:y4mF family transcriptional regulator
MTLEELGRRIRAQRTALGLTQREVASYANVGERFVVELEAGKPTLQLGKVLRVLATLGLRVEISP